MSKVNELEITDAARQNHADEKLDTLNEEVRQLKVRLTASLKIFNQHAQSSIDNGLALESQVPIVSHHTHTLPSSQSVSQPSLSFIHAPQSVSQPSSSFAHVSNHVPAQAHTTPQPSSSKPVHLFHQSETHYAEPDVMRRSIPIPAPYPNTQPSSSDAYSMSEQRYEDSAMHK